MSSIQIVPLVYNRVTKEGDFKKMIDSGQHNDTLILYNENCKDMYNLGDDTPGAGTAAIRDKSWLYNQDKEDESVLVLGIPTGVSTASGGFKVLDQDAKQAIQLSFMRIIVLVRRFPHIKRIVYSADPDDTRLLGTSVFAVDAKVLNYISRSIWRLPEVIDNKEYEPPFTLSEIRTKELELLVEYLKKENSALRYEAAKKRSMPSSFSSNGFGTGNLSTATSSGSITNFLYKRGRGRNSSSPFF